MNMFRNLLTIALLALGIGLWVGDPESWKWVTLGGPYVVSGFQYLIEARPLSSIVLIVLAVALFMTRKVY